MTIKRNETYTLELTGEQLAWILLLTGNTSCGWEQKSELFSTVDNMFGNFTPIIEVNLENIHSDRIEINRWLDELFLKELKDQ